jgi:hypothetical protein
MNRLADASPERAKSLNIDYALSGFGDDVDIPIRLHLLCFVQFYKKNRIKIPGDLG